MAMIKPTSIMK